MNSSVRTNHKIKKGKRDSVICENVTKRDRQPVIITDELWASSSSAGTTFQGF